MNTTVCLVALALVAILGSKIELKNQINNLTSLFSQIVVSTKITIKMTARLQEELNLL